MPVLVVQKGHCYRKTGATGTTGEQAYATAVAGACVRLLHGRGGWSVRSILADDDLVDYRGDAFVAIHCDGSIHPTARGASIGYRSRAGQLFGQAWKRAYAARGWTGGFRPDNYTAALQGYYGTGNAIAAGNTRAFIAECGFRTNSDDRALLDGDGGPERVALAIGDALGITPVEDDMELTDRVDWDRINGLGPDYLGHKILGTWQLAGMARAEAKAARAEIAGLRAAVDKLAGAVAGDDLTATELKSAVKAGVAEALAEGTVNVDIDITGPGGTNV